MQRLNLNLAWDDYSRLDQKGFGADPERITQIAVTKVKNDKLPLIAIDLGAGKGRDTKFLLSQGFKVLAVESNELSRETLMQLLSVDLTIQEKSFDEMDLSVIPESASIVNASYSLPYAGKDALNSVCSAISSKMISGGRFCGQFFGPRCTLVTNNPEYVAAHTVSEVTELLSTHHLELEECEIEQGPGIKMDGTQFEKDILHIIARKR